MNVAPVPPQPTPNRRKTGWIVGVALVAAALIGWGAFSGIKNLVRGVKDAQADGAAIADHVLGAVRDGTYEALWNEAAPEFQKTASLETWAAFMKSVGTTVGKPVSWTVTGFNRSWNNGVTTTAYTVKVTHERGGSNVTIRVDSQQRLLYFGVNYTK